MRLMARSPQNKGRGSNRPEKLWYRDSSSGKFGDVPENASASEKKE